MGKRESAAWFALVVFGGTGAASADTRLTDREQSWVRAGAPVIAYAVAQGLPIDIVVQPQPAAGLSPVAMGRIDGRCKLVFSLRGNPEADDMAERIPAALFTPIVEAIVAHEVAHCWRHGRGAWRTLPEGFSDRLVPALGTDPELKARWDRMRETRREEGFADLVGLAWTHRQHPAHYQAVRDWFQLERTGDTVPGSHHDTAAWLRLAGAPQVFAGASSPFEAAWPLWISGLTADD